MKRILLFFLALTLVFSCVPAFTLVQAETAPAVNHLLSNCESTSGWATEKTYGSLSLSSDAAVGSGSVQVTCQNEMYFFLVSPSGSLDFTNVTHLDFWFYTSDPKIFSYGDCGFNLSYSEAWYNEGVAVKAPALKALTLQEGWNHINVPFDFSGMSDSYDIEHIGRFRFYAVGLPTDVTMTVAVDEVRAVNEAGLKLVDQSAADAAIEAIDAIGTVNTYSRIAIANARSAYNALTDVQKALVTNADKLTAAETAFDEVSQNTTVTVPDDMKNNKPEQSTETNAWVISDCGSTNGITVSSAEDVNVVTVGGETYTAFTALSAGTVEVKAPHIMTTPVAISGFNKEDLALRFQFYVSDASAIKTNGQMELTSGKRPDTNELNWKTSQLELKNGWNVVYLDFADGADSNGTLDLSVINYMRLYMFLTKDVVMAFDSIKIVKRSVVSVSEDFSQQDSLLKWNGTNAQLTLQDQALAIQGDGQVTVATSSYDLPIVHPDRTPVEFTLFTQNPAGVAAATLVLTDTKGRVATASLDVSRLNAYNPTAYQVVPSETEQETGFNHETTTTVSLKLELTNTTVVLDNFAVTIRNGQYWRDWVYNYTTTPGDYSIAVIPDIQELTAAYPKKLDTIMQWLVDNKEKENIQFAIDVGDVTWNGHTKNEPEFQTAAAAFKKLQDAGIEYSVAYGNHDYTHGTPRDTALFNQYFPLSTFSTFGSYSGTMTAGKSDNTYYCFEVQNIPYMIVSLEFDPLPDTVAWANQVIAEHPNHNVIISTHNYLGEAYGKYSYAGEYLWPDLVSKHKNIFMVVCGHSILSDPALAGCISYREDVGVNGNTVYQVMANAQDIDAARGGVGMLLMMRFRDGGKTIDFNYFSPVNENLAYRTQNQFSVTIPEAELVVPPQEAFTSWSENLSPIFHVGLSTATGSDTHWNDYRYIAQPFIPESDTLHGVRLPLNLTSGEATLHLEIRSELNGEAIASSDTVIQSKGDGMYWYDALLNAPLAVEAGKNYYLTYHLTARDAGSVCVAYGTDLGSNNATHPGAVWKMADGAPTAYTATSHLHFGFELITEAQDAPVSDFTSWSENLSPIFHVGLSTATGSDAHWNDYRYIAQPFVPQSDTLYGVRLPLNLTSGEATLHLEIRSELNGEAIASSDTVIRSQGDGMYWYDAPLTAPLTVESGKTYYIVYYLTARKAGSVCIAYGTDLGTNNAPHPGAVWKMADGAPTAYTATSYLHFGFELMDQGRFVAIGVINQIDGLDGTDATAVQAARTAYEGLTDEQKALVTNLAKLEGFEKALGDQTLAKVVEDRIDALDGTDPQAVEAARSAYNALTDSQKQLVTNLAKLEGFEKALDDQAAAKAVEDQINALDVKSLDDKPAVQAAREAYDALTDEQKDLVTNLQKLTDAETKIADLEKPVDPPVAIIYGDVDGNGKVEATDALEVLKSVVGKVTLTDEQLKAADTDVSGKADATDALNILKKVVGKIDQFPVEQ